MFDSTLTVGEARGIYNLASAFYGNYDLGQVDQLIALHAAGSGSTLIDGLRWDFIDGLTGNPGDFYQFNGLLVQQFGATTGVAVPEPSRAAFLALALSGLALGRRRR